MTTAVNDVNAVKNPNAWNPVEPQLWGGPRDKSYPAPTEILHLSVYHSGPGIDELVRFYQVALNLRFMFRGNYGTWEFIALSHDDENHRVGILNAFEETPSEVMIGSRAEMGLTEGTEPRHFPMRPCRLEHMSWLYHDFESILLSAKRTHEELGVWPRTTRLSPVDFTIDYLDPDGNRVEMLTQFASTRGEYLFGLHAMLQHMAELEKTEGPQIANYDLFYLRLDMEKLIGLYESGVPISELQSRSFAERMKAEGKL